MVYLLTNVTDSTNDPKSIRIADIPNRVVVEVAPGETVDLERFSTRNQILDSLHIKVHLNEGRITVDTLGSEPRERIYVDAKIPAGGISVGSVTLDEPIQISASVGGSETALTATVSGSHVYLDVNPLLPNLPKIDEIPIVLANVETSFILPAKTQKFLVYAEGDACIQMGFVAGGSKISINNGANYDASSVDANSLTLYFESDEPSSTIKVLSWAVS